MNIYISNLSYGISDNDLNELFSEYGSVASAKVIMDRYTGKSRGFGFVEMPDETEANRAIEELNQAEYDGKVITVNIAKPREERPRSNDRGGFNRGGGDRGGFNRGGGDRGGFNRGGDRGGFNRGGGDRGGRY